MKIQPLGGRILVRPEKGEAESKGGILLPEEYRKEQASQLAVVAALGTGAYVIDKKTGKATPRPFHVQKGDRVVVSKYGGAAITIGDEEFKLFDEDEVLAVLK